MSVRYDWYQNDEKVVVTILLKNAIEKNYKCEIEESCLQVTAENYELTLNLSNPVAPEKSTHKATPHKIEVVLFKKDFCKWPSLEKQKEEKENKVVNPKVKKPQDWEQLAKTIEKSEDNEEVSIKW